MDRAPCDRGLFGKEGGIRRHELLGTNLAGKRSELLAALSEVPAQLARVVKVFVDVLQLELCHGPPHASSHDAARAFCGASTSATALSPVSTRMVPSCRTVTPTTRKP